MKKTCVFSRPVRTVVDELTTALLQRLGDKEGAAMLMSVAENVDRRLSDYRHDRYKGRKALQMVVSRLPDAPDELLVKLDLKKAVDVKAKGIDLHTEVPLSLIAEGLAAKREEKVQETSLEEALDELESAPVPTFDDFKDVFRRYPHVMRIKGYDHHPNGFRDLLVLGYSSNRNPETDQLIRRNCAICHPDFIPLGSEIMFNDIVSVLPVFQKKHRGYHFTIKVIPYHPGTGFRFWTNIQGIGDNVKLSRYIFADPTEGLVQAESREHLAALHRNFVEG